MLLILLIQWVVTQIWRFQYPLLTLVWYYWFNIYRNVQNYKKTFRQEDPYLNTIERTKDKNGVDIELRILIKRRRKVLIRTIFEDVLMIFTCIFLIVYWAQMIKVPSCMCAILLIIALLSKFICQKWPNNQWEVTFHIFSIWGSVGRILIFSFIWAKFDGLINWKWGAVLWAYWMLIVIVAILALFSLIIFLNSIISYSQSQYNIRWVFGMLWITVISNGILLSSLICTIFTIAIFDKASESPTGIEIFCKLFLPFFIYLIALIFTTLIFWNSLISFWDYFIYGNDSNIMNIEGSQLVQEVGQDYENQSNQQNIITVNIETPIFLKRISNTLFIKSSK